MKILGKRGNTVEILSLPGDMTVERGDFLLASEGGMAMVLQVIDIGYADLPGVMEDLLREMSLELTGRSRIFDPFNISSLTMMIRDSRVITTKLRRIISSEGGPRDNVVWIPSRFSAELTKLDAQALLEMLVGEPAVPIWIGSTGEKELVIDASNLDGNLTVITGKKESGKSHMAKLLSAELATRGAYVVVLDVNGEYVNLGLSRDGGPSFLSGKVVVLEPCRNFRAGIAGMPLKVLVDILEHVYATPSVSIREFIRIWSGLTQRRGISTAALLNAIQTAPMNESVRDALLGRVSSLLSSGFVTDGDDDGLEDLFARHEDGSVIVVRLDGLVPQTRRMVVEYLLSRLTALLTSGAIPPIFLIAEEAHLYLRDTYWEDIVTRMRHIGISPIFVTNQPDTIPETIYRQADNVFLFNFMNESDLEGISRYSHVDAETVKAISPNLPRGWALLLGRMVGNIPLVARIRDPGLSMMGATKLFFKKRRKKEGSEGEWKPSRASTPSGHAGSSTSITSLRMR